MSNKKKINLFIKQFNKLLDSSKESEERIKQFNKEFDQMKKEVNESINRPPRYVKKSE